MRRRLITTAAAVCRGAARQTTATTKTSYQPQALLLRNSSVSAMWLPQVRTFHASSVSPLAEIVMDVPR